MTRTLFTLILVGLTTWGWTQSRVYEQVSQVEMSGPNARAYQPLIFTSNDVQQREFDLDGLKEGTILTLNAAVLQELMSNSDELIRLAIPVTDRTAFELVLVQHQIFSEDFAVYGSDDPGTPVTYRPGLHFKGYIEGNPNSVAAISIFNDQVMGMITTEGGNLVLGPIENDRESRHVLFNDRDLDRLSDFLCGTPDDGLGYTEEQLKEQPEGRDVGDCIRVYIEIDDDIVTQKGGATPATNYITGLFNQSIVLYSNESISMTISQILAWTTPAPYSGSSSSAMLSSYQSNTGSFNGDLSHLVSYQASGGIAAGIGTMCSSNVDWRKCFSSISSSYSSVPTYSWSVMVVTHEMGHLIGSRHTHACVWNGNNTAIDGCAGGVEGNCPLPGYPSGGGTIMSYCHLQSVGINFNNGFGSQPGNVIRNAVNATGNCLTTCGPPPPPPPPSYCASNGNNSTYEYINRVQLGTLNNLSGNNGGYGNYTAQSTTLSAGTAYTITLTPGFPGAAYNEYWRVWIDYNGDLDWSDAGEQVAQGSGSSAISVNFTVPAGSPAVTTRMRVSMQYNGYPPNCGSFSYGEVEDYTIVIAGGSGATCSDGIQNQGETGVDCGGPCPPCPTCDDGIQNQGETGVDCGGPCPACPTCDDGIQNQGETGVDCGGPCPPCPPGGEVVLNAAYFETGWDGWQDGGSDVARVNSAYSWEGNYSIRLADNSGTASAMTSPSFNLSDATGLEIEFYFYSYSMENGEDFWVRYNNGSGWTTIAQFAQGTHFNNNGFYVVTLPVPNFSPTSSGQLRIQCDASGNADQIYIDQVTITKFTGGNLIEPGAQIVAVDKVIGFEGISLVEEEQSISLYPNPAREILNVQFNGPISDMRMVTVAGRTIPVSRDAMLTKQIQIQDLAPGLYILLIQSGDEWHPARFVKE